MPQKVQSCKFQFDETEKAGKGQFSKAASYDYKAGNSLV